MHLTRERLNLTFAAVMAISAKKINIFLVAIIVLLLGGSIAYRSWNAYKYAAIGVNIGETAPEISLPDVNGQLVTLSSLRGNYVLVDFWAAWCKPCRAENPNLMLAYETYSSQRMKNNAGFKILSVSADENEAMWKEAIARDLLKGPIHVSDLKGWNSPVFHTYGIQSIPSNVLLDPEGKIIAVKLRGEALLEELQKYVEK